MLAETASPSSSASPSSLSSARAPVTSAEDLAQLHLDELGALVWVSGVSACQDTDEPCDVILDNHCCSWGDAETNCFYLNRPLREFTGLSEGQNLGDLVHPEDRQLVMRASQSGGSLFSRTFRLRRLPHRGETEELSPQDDPSTAPGMENKAGGDGDDPMGETEQKTKKASDTDAEEEAVWARMIETVRARLDAEGELVGWIGVLQDISNLEELLNLDVSLSSSGMVSDAPSTAETPLPGSPPFGPQHPPHHHHHHSHQQHPQHSQYSHHSHHHHRHHHPSQHSHPPHPHQHHPTVSAALDPADPSAAISGGEGGSVAMGKPFPPSSLQKLQSSTFTLPGAANSIPSLDQEGEEEEEDDLQTELLVASDDEDSSDFMIGAHPADRSRDSLLHLGNLRDQLSSVISASRSANLGQPGAPRPTISVGNAPLQQRQQQHHQSMPKVSLAPFPQESLNFQFLDPSGDASLPTTAGKTVNAGDATFHVRPSIAATAESGKWNRPSIAGGGSGLMEGSHPIQNHFSRRSDLEQIDDYLNLIKSSLEKSRQGPSPSMVAVTSNLAAPAAPAPGGRAPAANPEAVEARKTPDTTSGTGTNKTFGLSSYGGSRESRGSTFTPQSDVTPPHLLQRQPHNTSAFAARDVLPKGSIIVSNLDIPDDRRVGEELRNVPLFVRLSDAERAKLGGVLKCEVYSEGEYVIRQGDIGKGFFVVKNGNAGVFFRDPKTQKEIQLDILSAGDYFGEAALLHNKVRGASVRAIQGSLEVWFLERSEFSKLFAADSSVGINFPKRRPAISSEATRFRDKKSKQWSRREGVLKRPPADAAATKKTEDDIELILEAVKDNLLFAGMSREHKLRIIEKMWKLEVPKFTDVITQGEIGDNFYVVKEGKFDVCVEVDQSGERKVHPFQSRGAIGGGVGSGKRQRQTQHPIQHASFAATVASAASMSSSSSSSSSGRRRSGRKITKKVDTIRKGDCFGEVALMYDTPRNATITALRDGVLWAVDRFTYRSILANVSSEKLQKYEQFLSGVRLLAPLSHRERSKVAEALEAEEFQDGEFICREGEQGNAMYIISSGTVEVVKHVSGAKQQHLRNMGVSDFFGEKALVNDSPRTASVIARGPVEVLKLDRTAFRLLLGPLEDILNARADRYEQSDLQVIQEIRRSGSGGGKQDPDSPSSAASVAVFDSHHQHHHHYPQHHQHHQHPKHHHQHPHRHPPTSVGGGGGPQHPAETTPGGGSSTGEKRLIPRNLQEINVLSCLGAGSFARVVLGAHHQSQELFALKVIDKEHCLQNKQETHVLSEKRTLLTLRNHPFIIRLHTTFQDTHRLYFVMEPALGGDLFTLLRQHTLFDRHAARFYTATITMVLEFMHERDIVYRDLKPENCLLDRHGFLKLADFGFAKYVPEGRTFTLCGTPAYLAPEVITGQGHGKGVDWWCVGIFLFEMLVGNPPFEASNPMSLYQKIMHGNFQFPSHVPEDARDLILRLCQHKPTQRLGVVNPGVARVRDHPFFEGFDWEALYFKRVRPPIVPFIETVDSTPDPVRAANALGQPLLFVDDGTDYFGGF